MEQPNGQYSSVLGDGLRKTGTDYPLIINRFIISIIISRKGYTYILISLKVNKPP